MDRYLIRRTYKRNDSEYRFYIGRDQIAEPNDDYFTDEWKKEQSFNGFEEASNEWKKLKEEFDSDPNKDGILILDILPIEICK